MVDDVKNNPDTTVTKVGELDPTERAKLVRERREAEQRRRLDELRAHAAAAQQQRIAREEERRRRTEQARIKDEERRAQVEERKRAIWESTVERRSAMAERDRERAARVQAARAARVTPTRAPFAFGSSTPRLLEPADTGGMLWSHRRAASTSNVMMTSAPLTRRSSFYDLDRPDGRSDDKKDDSCDKSPLVWSSVARRKTDLVPTIPAPRNNGVGRAYSMTRLDRAGGTPRQHTGSMMHLNRAGKRESGVRSGSSTPISRPSSALSSTVPRRPASAPRRPRPTSLTPSVSADENETPRRPRPVSMHLSMTTTPTSEGKPPLHRKPKLSKEQVTPKAGSESPNVDRSSVERQVKSAKDAKKEKLKSDQVNATEVTQKLEALQIQNKKPALAPKPDLKKPVQKPAPKPDTETKKPEAPNDDKTNETNLTSADITSQESVKPAQEVVKPVQEAVKVVEETVKVNQENVEKVTSIEESVKQVEAVVNNVAPVVENVNTMFIENEKKQNEAVKAVEVSESVKLAEDVKPVEAKIDEKKVEKQDDVDMTASMMSRSMRITTEEEAKAALAERRRKAREEAEKRAREEQERLARELEEEAERQRQEEEKQRQLEEEARELAELQRKMEEEKLRKAIEEQEAATIRAEQERLRAEEEKARAEVEKARAEAERIRADAERRAELQREEDERRERRKRVEAIMARTRKKAEEEKIQQEESERLGGEQPQQTTENNNTTKNPFENGTNVNGNNVQNQSEIVDQSKEDTLISFDSGDTATTNDDKVVNLVEPLVDTKMTIGDDLLGDSPKLANESNGFTIQNGHKDNKEYDVLNNGSHHPTLTNAV